ncbi:uncharacterized protein TNCV_1982851 [Trichonephila clavipes]|nr:uncharacterized protein TNCV_1982851 [Trichonephila clavipes]
MAEAVREAVDENDGKGTLQLLLMVAGRSVVFFFEEWLEAEIDRLQAYYGLAIRRNLSSVKDMQQAIWAIFLHKLSTDEKPQHGFCPSDTDTWCKFKKAELLGRPIITKNSLPVDVVEAMRPVFRDLANPELLKKSVYMEPGDYTVQAMECLDKQRLLRAKYYCLQKTKEVRKEKRLKRKKEDDKLLKNADDLEYGAGMF